MQKPKIMAPSSITSWQIDGETTKTVRDFIFLGSKITADGDYSHEIKRFLLLGRKSMTSLDNLLKSRDITLLTKVHFSSSHVWMCKEGWAPKNWCFWTVVLEKIPESPLGSKEIKPVNPRKIHPGYSLEGLKLKLQVFWIPDAKTWLIRKVPDAGKDWRQEEEETTEDKMVG